MLERGRYYPVAAENWPISGKVERLLERPQMRMFHGRFGMSLLERRRNEDYRKKSNVDMRVG